MLYKDIYKWIIKYFYMYYFILIEFLKNILLLKSKLINLVCININFCVVSIFYVYVLFFILFKGIYFVLINIFCL